MTAEREELATAIANRLDTIFGKREFGPAHQDYELADALLDLGYRKHPAVETIHVHHHDIEHHAASFNEGYEAAMAQHLADDPSLAEDWLNTKLADAWDKGFYAGYADGTDTGPTGPANPYKEAQ